MEQQTMDPSWITTDKSPALAKSRGFDTCARINSLITYSHTLITALIPEQGEFQVKCVVPMSDVQFVHVTFLDTSGKEFHYALPWYAKFNLYLGVR